MFSFDSIQQYHADLLHDRVSCVSAVEFYLQKIKDQAHLNALTHLYEEEALHTARKLDADRAAGKKPGRLHGVVVAIKDVISYEGHELTACSNMLTGFKAIYNATAVQRLIDEEAIIIGNTNCDEFAMGSTNENSSKGPVLNAINNERVAGGSSGGSAVAVQADLCMVSLGSDTGGSVRQPADFCGIVGLKPTYGRISRYGLIAYASSFDQIGIFSKNIPDVSLVLEVISGNDSYDSTASSKDVPSYSLDLDSQSVKGDSQDGKKIGYFRQALESPALDPEIAAGIKGFTDKLSEDGYDVQPIDFELLDYIVPAYYVLTTAEASSNLSRYDGIRYGFRNVDKNTDLTELYKISRSEGFGKEVKRRIMLGTFVLSSGYYDAYYSKAQKVRRLLSDQMELIFKEFDAVILPTVPSTAFSLGQNDQDPIAMYMADIFTVLANLTGLPAISLPLFWHSNGLPFGLQVMTNRFDELSLLQLSNKWL
ncbi:MAG: Asp-tRNA(Asn)/Glu-tRNA(Gln) amidotransferase subunit GatA, partial [Flavitalea sp.]